MAVCPRSLRFRTVSAVNAQICLNRYNRSDCLNGCSVIIHIHPPEMGRGRHF